MSREAKMRAKHTLVLLFERNGMKLRTWAFSMGLSKKDANILYQMNVGNMQGVRGRAKELKELLEKEGFVKGLKRIDKDGDTDSAKDLKKGA